MRLGLRISAAAKVTSFQALAEKSGPTRAMRNTVSNASPPCCAEIGDTGRRSGVIVTASRGVHIAENEEKLAARAPALRPTRRPSTISAASARVFTAASTFWISLPVRNPKALTALKTTMSRTATSCWTERLTAYPGEMSMGLMRKSEEDTPGAITPRNRAKATATAAMVPV